MADGHGAVDDGGRPRRRRPESAARRARSGRRAQHGEPVARRLLMRGVPSGAQHRVPRHAGGCSCGVVGGPEGPEERSAAMWQHLRAAHRDGFEPWASMYIEGHGRHWHDTTKFIHHHHDTWQTALRTPGS